MRQGALLNCSLVPIFDFGNSPTARSTAGLGEFPVRHYLLDQLDQASVDTFLALQSFAEEVPLASQPAGSSIELF
jgi:hypothetical protein